jgi:hypothetical protein
MESLIILAGGLAGAVIAYLIWRPLRSYARTREEARAMGAFRLQREQLEAKFFDLAAAQGKPRGLVWRECEWNNNVVFARDLHSGLLTAFVAVNVRFEAVEGGDMENVEAVGVIRDAAAVFHYRRGRWGTGGKTLFNMNPADALKRLEGQYQLVTLKSPPSTGIKSGSGIR